MNLSSDSERKYGIIPWLHDGNQWYFLTQVGYSACLYDFKVDPLRGQQEEHETPWETAVREVKEESGTHCWCQVHKRLCSLCLLRDNLTCYMYIFLTAEYVGPYPFVM